jgi:hypothetical protein
MVYWRVLTSSLKRYSTALALGKFSEVRIMTTGSDPTSSAHLLFIPSSSVTLRTVISSSIDSACHPPANDGSAPEWC